MNVVSVLAVFEFSSLPMLGWLAAAALPWLIHRWHRRQHRTTSWAAVELLLSAMQQRARRVQMQQWLLLAVRTGILVLVALAVAEPALRQWASGAGGEASTHQIMVLDQSYSMGCARGANSRWERAKTAAQQWIETNTGNPITLVTWGDRTESVLGRPTYDNQMALAALEELAVSHTTVELQAVVRSITAAIERAEAEMPQVGSHQVVFCTDLCAPTWDVGESEQELLEGLSKQANVTFVNVSEDQTGNIAITELLVDPPVTLRQRDTSIVATVASFGDPSASECSVELQIDGQIVDQQAVQLARDGKSIVRFKHQFIDQDAKTLKVSLRDHEDCLSVDDQRWLVVDVKPRLRVACFAGEVGAADDLVRALSPDPAGTPATGSIAPESYSVSRLSDLELSHYAAILLGSVTDLSQREVRTLQDYLRQGGGLAVFLGSEMEARTQQQLQSILPVHLGGIHPMGDFRFDPREYRHSIVAPFRGQTQAGLLGVAISQYHRLALLPDRSSAEIPLQFDSGDPALVVDRFGLGRVAVFALPGSLGARTSSGSPWSSFPVSPSFLPIIRELVAYLVESQVQQRNLLVGETATIPWPDNVQSALVTLPDGQRHDISSPAAEDNEQIVFGETYQQGIYQFEADGQELARLAVNLDPREADLRPRDATQLPSMMANQQAPSTSTFSPTVGEFLFARSLLAGALVLLLIEIGLAYVLGRAWG